MLITVCDWSLVHRYAKHQIRWSARLDTRRGDLDPYLEARGMHGTKNKCKGCRYVRNELIWIWRKRGTEKEETQ